MRMGIGELNHVFAVVAIRLAFFWFDDDGAIGAIRFLKSRMTVEPIGAGLLDREIIGESLA